MPATPDLAAEWGPERAHLRLDTDPWGRPHLPGTSLAGALRDMVRVADGADVSDELFGRLREDEVASQASLIWVLGSRPADVRPAELRASTGISRQRGAPGQSTLRVEELLPAGSGFEVFLRWDNAQAGQLDRFLRLLAAWRPLIGRGTSRGRGRCAAGDVRYGTVRLDDRDGLRTWLTMNGPELVRAVATTRVAPGPPAADRSVVFRVPLRIIGPLLTGSGQPAEPSGVHVARLFRSGDRYVLPGTGLKGLLRSRAEYILRGVHATPPPCLDQRCGACWTCGVFGYGGGQDDSSPSAGRRALIRVTDAVVAGPHVRERQHVAVDRFTGGAADQLLYTMEGLEQGSFTLRVEMFAAGLPARELAEIRAVLRLVLEDLNDGIIGIGAAVTRGYGSVAVDDFAAAESSGELPTAQAAREELGRMLAASS